MSYPMRLALLVIPVQGRRGFPGGSTVKNLSANAGDTSLIPGSGRFPEESMGGRGRKMGTSREEGKLAS